MHVGYVPFRTKSANDIVWLSDATKLLVKRSRLLKPFIERPGIETPCFLCDRVGVAIEMHHKRPLWAWALRMILSDPPLTRTDSIAIERQILQGRFDGNTMEAHEELVPLCKKCHVEAGNSANETWKDVFSERYPLIWITRWTPEQLRSLVDKFYPEVAP